MLSLNIKYSILQFLRRYLGWISFSLLSLSLLHPKVKIVKINKIDAFIEDIVMFVFLNSYLISVIDFVIGL